MAGSLGPGWTGPDPTPASSSADDNAPTIASDVMDEGYNGDADDRSWVGDIAPDQPTDPDPGNTFMPGSFGPGIGPGYK